MNARETAVVILDRIERDGAWASPLIEGVEEKQRPFVHALVVGTLRWRGRLDWLIETFSGRPVAKVDQRTRSILRAGIYQLFDMKDEPYAVVDEMVTIASRRARSAKGFVNAILRKASSSPLRSMGPPGESLAALAVRWSHPEWLLGRWIQNLGLQRALRIAEANQQHSAPDLVVNTTRISMSAMRSELLSAGYVTTPSPFVAGVLRGEHGTASLHAEIEGGLVYPMDEGSAVVASLVRSEGGVVLDMAAAPGGKTLVMTLGGNRVVSNDISFQRLGPLRRSFSRFFGRPATILVGDGRMLPLEGELDTILLDAPCSATGTLRKNPELKWRLRPEDIARTSALQRQLLARAVAASPRELIYATCSLEPEENDEVVAPFANLILPVDSDPVSDWVDGGVLRLTPDSGADGFTVTRLRCR